MRRACYTVGEFKRLMIDELGNFNSSRNVEVDHSMSTCLRWSPPPNNWFNLNVDATGPVNDFWGDGAIIRDEHGFIMAAATWKFYVVPDVDIVEAIGLRLGLNFAKDLGFVWLLGETDSLNVAVAMKNSVHPPSHLDYVILISDCNSLFPFLMVV